MNAADILSVRITAPLAIDVLGVLSALPATDTALELTASIATALAELAQQKAQELREPALPLVEKPKRGRPAGSRTRNRTQPAQAVLPGATVTEGTVAP